MKYKEYGNKILIATKLQLLPTTYGLIPNLTYYLSTNLLPINLGYIF
jgi:hypothetical protein